MIKSIMSFFTNRSLFIKLIIGVLSSIIICFSLFTIFISDYLKPIIEEQIILQAKEEISELTFDIYKNTNIAEQAILTTAKILSEQETLSKEYLLNYSQATLKSLYDKYKFFYSIWIFVLPEDENEKGILYQNEVYNNMLIPQVFQESDELSKQQWKIETLKKGGICWSEPFKYSEQEESEFKKSFYSVSVSVPFQLKNSKKISGIIGIAIDLRRVQEQVSSLKLKNGGKLLLLSQKGKYIVHPDPSIQMNRTIFDLAQYYDMPQLKIAGENLAKNKSGFIKMSKSTVFDSNVVFVYTPIQKLYWGACLVFPSKAFFESAYKIQMLIFCSLMLTLFVLCCVIYLICSNITKPLKKLSVITDEYGHGNFLTQLPNIKSNDEIGRLTQSFSSMKDNILKLIKDKEQEAIESQRRNSELEIARKIQTSVLSTNFPTNSNISFYALMSPAKKVGGDFYDFFFINENKFAFLIADVSGKGIPAALFMMNAKGLLKEVIENSDSLVSAINKANNIINRANDVGLFITAFVAILDIKTGELEYVNAGHNPPLLKVPNEKYSYLEINGNIALGAMGGVSYKSCKMQLQPKSGIFLYTDGITDALNKENKFYGEQRLKDCINSQSLLPEDTIKNVKKDVDEFSCDQEQFDDMTMVNLVYFGNKNN